MALQGSASLPSVKLAELGLTLPPVAAPVAAYVPAVRVGDLVYSSGQLPTVAGQLVAAVIKVPDLEPSDGAGRRGSSDKPLANCFTSSESLASSARRSSRSR